MGKLKPCPFCNAKAKLETHSSGVHPTVLCTECDAEMSVVYDVPAVIRDWNTRPIEDALRADLARKDELIEALRGVNVAYEKLRLKFVGIVIGMTEALEAAELEAEGLEAALGRLSELTDALVAARTRLAEVEGSCKPTVDDCPAHQPKAHDPA